MRLRYINWLFLLTIIFSCGDDAGVEGDNILSYDGENATAPVLPPGSYNTSVRFTSNLLRNVEGRTIESVGVYIYEIPDAAMLTIYYDDTPQEPGSIAYSQDITSSLNSDAWNTINLTTPFEITGEPIWLGVQFNLNTPSQIVGCDQGPANPNGDWLFDSADQEWLRFENRVGDSINWNIRAVLSP